MATNPTIALVNAASAAYAAASALALSGGHTELAAAYGAVRDALDMMGDGDDGDGALALLGGTVKPAMFCREQADAYADMAEHDDDAETAADSLRIVRSLRAAARVFANVGR